MFKYALTIGLVVLCQLNAWSQRKGDSSWFNLGVNYYTHLKPDKAIYYFSVSIESEYKVAWSYAYRAASEMLIGRLEEADADMNTAMKIDSPDCNMFFLKGRLCNIKDEYDSAVFWCRKAVLADTSRAEFNDELATAYRGIKSFDLALKYGKDALKAAPGNQVYIGNLALTKQGMENYADAIGDLELALKLDPGNYTNLANLAFCKYKLKAYTEALSICDNVIAAHPDFGYVYLVRGQVKYDMGQKAGACKDFQQLLLSKDYKKKAPDYLKKYGCPVNAW